MIRVSEPEKTQKAIAAQKDRDWIASSRVPALFCAASLLVAALLVNPRLEMAVNDDWSYTKSAQVLAQTGHIAYNGWATAMLGWQLYLGALAIRLFGFSFTAVRLSMLLPAMLTAFLMQRSLVRAGVNETNASVGTLGLVFSPLFLPLCFTFMSDIPGLLVIVMCFYCCLRVLQAGSDRARMGWLLLAIASNAFGGTVRQIAWLGMLVMVPCLLWIERRRRNLLVTGVVATLAGVAVVAWLLHWFHAQPYALPEPLLSGKPSLKALLRLCLSLADVVLELAVLLLPFLICFVPAMSLRQRGARVVVGVAALFTLAAAVAQFRYHHYALLLAPFLGNCITIFGVMDVTGVNGTRPVVLPEPLRVVLALLGIVSVTACLAVYWSRPARRQSEKPPMDLGRQLSWLIVPFLAAYLFLLMPRGAFTAIFDRYLLAPAFFLTLGILRLYQSRVRVRLPLFAAPVLGIFALFAVAGAHDFFSLSRARLAAASEVHADGVAVNQISGTFEYNSWNEIERAGYVADPRLPGGKPLVPPDLSDVCAPPQGYLAPHLERRFALSSNPQSCLGPAGFAPVSFRTWLPPWRGAVYVVRDQGRYDGQVQKPVMAAGLR